MKKKEKKNKIVSYLVILFLVVAFGCGLWYKLANRQVYIPDIPNSHNLSSISYELPTGIITVAEEEKMDKILEGLHSLNLSTKTVSVQDSPTDVEDIVYIRFYYKEDAVGNLFIYKKNNKYYAEEPYNGIYKIDEEKYNYIIDLVKESE